MALLHLPIHKDACAIPFQHPLLFSEHDIKRTTCSVGQLWGKPCSWWCCIIRMKLGR